MKKKEKLKAVVKPNYNQIVLSELEIRQVMGKPKSGGFNCPQFKTVRTNLNRDEAEITETKTIWGLQARVDCVSGDTTPWIEKHSFCE